MPLPKRTKEPSAPLSRERHRHEKSPSSDTSLYEEMCALLADQAIFKMRKQELEKQASENAIKADELAKGRFDEFPSAIGVNRKERDRIDHDKRRVISDLDANSKEIQKHIREYMSRLGPSSVGPTAQPTSLPAHSDLEALERKMAERFTAYDKKYEAQEDALKDQSRQIASLREQVQGLQTQNRQIPILQSQIESVKSEHKVLQTENKQIPILQSQVESLKSEHKVLQTENKQIPILQSQVESLKSEHERLRSADSLTRPTEGGTELQAIGAQIKDLHDKIESLRDYVETSMDMVENAVKTAECDVPALKDRVSKQELAAASFQEQTQASFRNFAAQFSELIEDLVTQTDKLEARIKSIEDSRVSLEVRIGLLEARVLPAKESALGAPTMTQADPTSIIGDGDSPVIDFEARHTALDTARLQAQQPGEVALAEAKQQLATLQDLVESQRAYVATLASELGTTIARLNDLKTDHARQGVVLNGAQHAISNLSQQFNNLTTEDMLEKMYVHIVSLKSHENEGRRAQIIELRVKALEDQLASQNFPHGDTMSKKRKTGLPGTMPNGHP